MLQVDTSSTEKVSLSARCQLTHRRCQPRVSFDVVGNGRPMKIVSGILPPATSTSGFASAMFHSNAALTRETQAHCRFTGSRSDSNGEDYVSAFTASIADALSAAYWPDICSPARDNVLQRMLMPIVVTSASVHSAK